VAAASYRWCVDSAPSVVLRLERQAFTAWVFLEACCRAWRVDFAGAVDVPESSDAVVVAPR
jgi:hypothetical protein